MNTSYPRSAAGGQMLASFLLLLAFCPAVHPAEEAGSVPVLSPPDFLRNKPPLPDMLLKDKREGRYFTGFPAIGWDPETGFGLGAAVQMFNNGPKDSSFFRYTPYRRRFAVGVLATTRGYRNLFIGYDQPYIRDSPWRVRGAIIHEDNRFENYFGVGEQTLDRLRFPGSPQSFKRYDDYHDAMSKNVNGQTWENYDDYRRKRGGAVLTVERDFVGGLLRPQIGFQFFRVNIDDYTGRPIDGAVMQETRLREHYLQGHIRGFEGGWDNALKLGLTFDSRDFEPDPNSGVMAQATVRIASEGLGSEYGYIQSTLSARAFFDLLPEVTRLIFAPRLTYAVQSGDYPFYSAPTLPFTDGDQAGLGGYATLRGYKQQRFIGDAAAWANAELRWSFKETMFYNQHLRFMLVPFVDTGRVFDSVGDTTLKGWKWSTGLGFRLAWNLSTIVSFDWAYSKESSLFYMELGHQF